MNSPALYRQLRDPDRNGGRNWVELGEHLRCDASQPWRFCRLGFAPGGGREPAPFGLQAHVDDVLIWKAAGLPCPE